MKIELSGLYTLLGLTHNVSKFWECVVVYQLYNFRSQHFVVWAYDMFSYVWTTVCVGSVKTLWFYLRTTEKCSKCERVSVDTIYVILLRSKTRVSHAVLWRGSKLASIAVTSPALIEITFISINMATKCFQLTALKSHENETETEIGRNKISCNKICPYQTIFSCHFSFLLILLPLYYVHAAAFFSNCFCFFSVSY